MESALQSPPAMEEPARRLWTTREFQRMAETGILSGHERIELIEGEIYEMTPVGNRHVWLVMRIAKAVQKSVPDTMAVSIQSSVELSNRTQVQPDVAILRCEPASIEDPLPAPADVLLIVEVADSSLPHDRKVKLPLYARAGVPEVWIVEVDAKAVEAHRRPSPAGYSESLRWKAGSGEAAVASMLPGIRIDLDQLFV